MVNPADTRRTYKTFYLVLACAIMLSSCGNSHIRSFYNHHKRDGESSVHFTIPGWLIWFGTGIANEFTKEPDVKAGLALAKKVKRFRIMALENIEPISANEVNVLLDKVRQDGFQELILVRDGSTTFTFMTRDNEEVLKNIMILVNEKNEFVLIDIKTKLRYLDITKLIKQFKKELKLEKPLKKLPQA